MLLQLTIGFALLKKAPKSSWQRIRIHTAILDIKEFFEPFSVNLYRVDVLETDQDVTHRAMQE